MENAYSSAMELLHTRGTRSSSALWYVRRKPECEPYGSFSRLIFRWRETTRMITDSSREVSGTQQTAAIFINNKGEKEYRWNVLRIHLCVERFESEIQWSNRIFISTTADNGSSESRLGNNVSRKAL